MLARGALRLRPVLRRGRGSIIGRCSFHGSSFQQQNARPPNVDGRTTHFGFETVAEAEKQGRGKADPS